jgi:hypothetical protein
VAALRTSPPSCDDPSQIALLTSATTKGGGDSVTAIAIQRTCQGIEFWVAANQGVKDIVTDFLRDVLQDLKGASVEYERAVQRSLLSKIVAVNKQRLDVPETLW